MKRRILFIILLISYCSAAFSQYDDGSFTWEDFVSMMADETDDENGPDPELFEELYELHTHPINLNECTEDDLKQLPFLSENEIKDIAYYTSVHKNIMSTGELMFIRSLSYQKRRMLQLFCYAGEIKNKNYSLDKLFKYSNNELMIRTDVPFYTKAGYQSVSDSVLEKSPNKVYQGNKLFHSMRYTFNSQNHFFAGLQLEKDAGENYIDHYAGYAMIKDIGHVHTAVVGNYRVSFGHGLVINTGSTFGKAMKMNSMEIIDRGITRHSSTSETGFLTGGAATLKYGNIKISAFASYRKADGTFNNDSNGLSSIKTDGLHRTELEKSKKNNINIADFGANVHFDISRLQLSLTAATTHLSEPLSPKYNTESTKYKYYSPKGTDFTAASIAYSYRTNNYTLSGETALSGNWSIASIDQIQWHPNAYSSLTAIYRYYQARYNALNARSFGENSSVRNEQGLYIGWKTEISNELVLSTYIDLMYFPWLKYQVYGSSYGYEGLAQLLYNFSDNHALSLRYRIKSKEKDYTTEDIEETTESNTSYKTLRYSTNQSVRIQHSIALNNDFTLKTTVCGTYIKFGIKESKGYSIGEAIRYTGLKKLRLDFAANYFNTDSYEARIYNYESSLLYSFSMTPYYYKGVRCSALVSWSLLKNINLTMKLSTTNYFDRETIGTALELIDANHKEELQIQIRYKY